VTIRTITAPLLPIKLEVRAQGEVQAMVKRRHRAAGAVLWYGIKNFWSVWFAEGDLVDIVPNELLDIIDI
jgi:hypothetical protein